MGAGVCSFFWTIYHAGQYRGVPVRQRTRNGLDAHGSFLDLERLENEDDVSYWKRLSSVFPLRAGSHQPGLVHGITRELGLEEKIGLKISPVYSGERWLAPAPYVDISATTITLYSKYLGEEFSENVIDTTIDIFDHGSGYILDDVVSQIRQSSFFHAELGPLVTGQEKANGLFPGSSIQYIHDEFIPSSTFFFLQQDDIVPGTVNFSDKEVFKNEVSPILAEIPTNGITLAFSINSPVANHGDYYIDYQVGSVTTYTSSDGDTLVRYGYRDFPWQVRWSPICVYSLRDPDYVDKLFETEVGVDNWSRKGLVNSEGSEVYSQIFRKSPCLWGE